VGGVIGGLAAVGLIAGGGYYLHKKSQTKNLATDSKDLEMVENKGKGANGAVAASSSVATMVPPTDVETNGYTAPMNGTTLDIKGHVVAMEGSAPSLEPTAEKQATLTAPNAASAPALPVSGSSSSPVVPQSTAPGLASLVGKKATATQAYKRQHEDELELKTGDQVVILTSHDGELKSVC
jgi:hypothetical protein